MNGFTMPPRPDGMINVTAAEVEDARQAQDDVILVRPDGTLTTAGQLYVASQRTAATADRAVGIPPVSRLDAMNGVGRPPEITRALANGDTLRIRRADGSIVDLGGGDLSRFWDDLPEGEMFHIQGVVGDGMPRNNPIAPETRPGGKGYHDIHDVKIIPWTGSAWQGYEKVSVSIHDNTLDVATIEIKVTEPTPAEVEDDEPYRVALRIRDTDHVESIIVGDIVLSFEDGDVFRLDPEPFAFGPMRWTTDQVGQTFAPHVKFDPRPGYARNRRVYGEAVK